MYWAYCVYEHDEGWRARGYVLATSKTEARAKAIKRVAVEQRRVAKRCGLTRSAMPQHGRFYRVRVWPDPDMVAAPSSRHYVERG